MPAATAAFSSPGAAAPQRRQEARHLRLTELGRFTGESGDHVDSIIRLVRGIGVAAGQLNSVALVAAAQLSALARNCGDVSAGGRAASAGVGSWAARRLSRRVRSDLVNFHWNGVAIC